jgi:hypothetical protein
MDSRDYQGNLIRITIPYDDDAHGGTHAINGTASIHRDAACVYTKAVIGNPAAPTATVPIPSGDHTFTQAQMAAIGLTNLDQITSTQITFIP